MNKFNKLQDCVVTNKNVIVRVDINVPLKDEEIQDDTRIRAVIPTLKYLAQNKAKVIVLSHIGRPKGKKNDEMSVKHVVQRVSQLLEDVKVNFVDDCVGPKVEEAVKNTQYGEVILLENIRFYDEETKNDPEFSKKLASLGNLYVNEAFSCSHRSHASITGIAEILKPAAGFLMEKELENLGKIFNNSGDQKLIAIVGGAKVSTKIDLLNSLTSKAKTIVVGGGMANTFLYALGNNIGNSLCEKDLKDTALKIIETAKDNGCELFLPKDVVVTKEFKDGADSEIINANNVADNDIIADMGPESVKELGEILKQHQILVWNGPVGAFELKPFNIGTESLAKIVAQMTRNNELVSVSGGGDSVSALTQAGVINDFSYISTAGGAFLEWLEGKELPGVAVLSSGSLGTSL